MESTNSKGESLLNTQVQISKDPPATGAATAEIVDPRIFRTGFLSHGDRTTLKTSLLGKTVTLPVNKESLEAKAVRSLPRTPQNGATYILLNDKRRDPISMHNLVRFPAKLHPPFVSWAVSRFTKPGDTVLDPFCGCGTVVLEATLRGRSAIGFDVDPFSALVAKSKCSPPPERAFNKAIVSLERKLRTLERKERVYERLKKGDITPRHFRQQIRDFRVPPIPKVDHWFKRYVLVDLLRIWSEIRKRRDDPRLTRYINASFASILRLTSNADPDTLSGLEVTKRMLAWMKRGRYINPFRIFIARLRRNRDPILRKFWDRLRRRENGYTPRIRACSALDGRSYRGTSGRVDAIITSPPYCSAVEYYRRHLLEHYWLGFIRNEERAAVIRRRYIGRRNYVYGNAEKLASLLPNPVSEKLRQYLGPMPPSENRRMRAIVRYFVDMAKWFKTAAKQLKPGGHLVLVVGDSTVKGRPIRTSELLKDLVPPELQLKSRFSYLLRNRTMQYSRWNEANVASENVMVFKKRKSGEGTLRVQSDQREQ